MNVDLPDEVFLAVNPRGILIINPETKDVLVEHPYSEVPFVQGCRAAVGRVLCLTCMKLPSLLLPLCSVLRCLRGGTPVCLSCCTSAIC